MKANKILAAALVAAAPIVSTPQPASVASANSATIGANLMAYFYHGARAVQRKKVTSYFGRLSMTRFALPMERSIVPIFTSALTPM